MQLSEFLHKLTTSPDTLEFDETMAVIDANYDFTPTAFLNGDTQNAAGENNGSCKLFAFAQLNNLTPEQTLACFGRYYREDVLQQPDESNHMNIRNFMRSGWEGIQFDSSPLVSKK